MLLAIDAGNTNIGFAIHDGTDWRGRWRSATRMERTSDEYAAWLLRLMEREGLSPGDIDAAIIGSVVPACMFDLTTLCRDYFGAEALVVGGADVDLGIAVRVERPSEVGADRLVNAVAAHETYGKPVVILDFGTATTFDVIDGEGAYRGGVIAPGINLSLETLHRAAAQLPLVAVARPQAVIGTDTVSAIQSGVYWGYVGLIEGLLSRIKAEFADMPGGGPADVVATGGLAPLFHKASDMLTHLDDDLTMRGLVSIYRRNAA